MMMIAPIAAVESWTVEEIKGGILYIGRYATIKDGELPAPIYNCIDGYVYEDTILPSGEVKPVCIGPLDKVRRKLQDKEKGVTDTSAGRHENDLSGMNDTLQKYKRYNSTTQKITSVNFATKKRGRPPKEGLVHRSTEYRRRKKEEQLRMVL